ncbi:MAG: alanine/ornithine racemase family PLP-dependent enzyme, partial [Firmicutes bacterium]|nr:alanine/ornithine racemase family PLP-dependent enzyme [Bacillota bacterium]
RINMLRIGEGIIVARDLIELYDYKMDYMETTVSKLQAEVIEVKVKPTHPVGEIGYDAFRRQPEYVDRGMRKRAIIAVGKIDYSFETGLTPLDEGVEVIGASSDHTLLDIEDAKRDIKVGDILEFNLDYGALAFLTQTSEVAVETV